MSILEEDVLVPVNGSNIKHFENLRYEIPRWKDTRSQMSVKRGTKILVKVKDLPRGSGIKVTKICDICGKLIPNQTYASIINNRNNGDGKDRCFNCGRYKAGETIINSVNYEKSLEYFALNNNKEYLIQEFSTKNDKKPNELYKTTVTVCIWNCQICGSEYDMAVYNRTSGNQNCPYCRGMRVNETNSLWAIHPEIAKLLTNPEDGNKVTSNSLKEVDFTCPECGNVNKKIVSNIVANGFSCTQCSDHISYPEKFMISILNQLNIFYKREKTFKWSKNIKCENKKLNGSKRYDFYIPSLNCIIETHGLQHYTQSFRKFGKRIKTVEEEKENDQLKEKIAKQNGIEHYIVIDCRISDLNYIKNNILSSRMNELFDLNEINWIECDTWATNSFTKIVCEVWNEGNLSTGEISDLLNITRGTVYKHLIKGVEIGFCDYIPEHGKASKRAVIQLTLDGQFIKEWESGIDAVKGLGINHSGVSECCLGDLKSSGGFRWVFKDEYNKENELNKTVTWSNKRSVIQLTKDNEYIKEWDSATEASKILGMTRQNISKACSGQYKQAGGYKWMYKTEYDQLIKQQN